MWFQALEFLFSRTSFFLLWNEQEEHRRSYCRMYFLLRFILRNLENSSKWPQSQTSFVGSMLGQTPVIGTTIAPPLSDETKGGAREEERDLCCSSYTQTINAAEGGPNTMLVWRCLPPVVCAFLCAPGLESTLCLCERVVESRGLRSLLPLDVPSSAQRPQAQGLSACA